jgi:hypothetical protein
MFIKNVDKNNKKIWKLKETARYKLFPYCPMNITLRKPFFAFFLS